MWSPGADTGFPPGGQGQDYLGTKNFENRDNKFWKIKDLEQGFRV